MIKYNPQFKSDGTQNGALTTAPSDSIIFDVPGKCIWVKGVKLATSHTYTFSHDNYITLTNTPGEPEDILIGVNTTALKNAIDTTYGIVNASTNGLAPMFSTANKATANAATTYNFLGITGSTLKWYQLPWRNVRINSDSTDKLGVNDTDPLIISQGTGISVTWDSTNKKIVITNTSPDLNHNTDYTTINKGTAGSTTAVTQVKVLSSTGVIFEGGTNKFKVGDGTNYFEIPITPSFTVDNKAATIGQSLTTIATINGTDITAKIGSYATSDHTHSVKINGSTKTIAAPGGTAVDLGSYLPLSGGTMNSGAMITWEDWGQWGASSPTYPKANGGLQWSGTSDNLKLFVEETASDDLRLILQCGDDASPQFNIRNYLGTTTVSLHSNGTITGTSIVNSGSNNNYVLLGGGGTKLISDFATSGHTHPLSIAADSGTSSITLAASTKYKLTAGGSTYIFTSTPDLNVKQTPKTDNVNRPLMMINGGTSQGEQVNTSMFSTGIYANASSKMITANGFIKAGSDDTYVLLGGGGHKALTDFAMADAYVKKVGDTMTGSLHLNYSYPLLQFHITELWGGSIGYENHANDSLTFSLTNLGSTFNFKSGHIFSSTGNYLDNTVTPDFRIGNSTGSPSNAYAKIGGNIVWHAGNDGAGSGLDADLLDGYHANDFATLGHNHDGRYARTHWSFASGLDDANVTCTSLDTWVSRLSAVGGISNYGSISVGAWWWVRSTDFLVNGWNIKTSGAIMIYGGDGNFSSGDYKHFLVLDAYADLYGITSNEASWKYYAKFLSTRNYTDYVYTKTLSDDRYVNITGDTMTGNLVVPSISIGNSSTSNSMLFHGLTGDSGVGNLWDNHFVIGNRIWNSATEASELILFCGNDIGNGNSATTGYSSGPDRIRHIAAAHLFQTYTSALSGDIDTVGTSSYLKNIFELNTNSIHSWVPATFDGRVVIGLDNDADASSNTSGSLMIGSASGLHLLFDANEIISASNTSASTLYLQYNGGALLVGGTANCSSTFYGQIYINGAYPHIDMTSTSAESSIYFRPSSGTSWAIGKAPWGVGGFGIGILNTGCQFTILDNGSTGIGITSPTQKLDVYGNICLGNGGSETHIYARTTNFNLPALSFYDDTSGYGTMAVLGGGGCTVVGSGESAHEFAPNVRDENLYLTADANVNIFTNLDGGYGSRRHVAQFNTNGDTYLYGNLYLGANASNNFIAFYGNTGDAPGSYITTFIGEHLWGGGESTELLLMKFNDVGNGTDATTAYSSGPDRIRYCAHAHLFQIRTDTGQGAFATMAADGNNKTVLLLALNRMTVHTPIHVSCATSLDMSYSTANPKIYFSENGSQAVGLVYCDYDAYRPSKGIKCMDVDGNDPSNVWFEALGNMYASHFYETSDIRLKHDISSISQSIRKFRFNNDNKLYYGFIAQELETLHPELVDSSGEYKTVNYNSAICFYIAELENKVQKLEDEINKLKNK